MFVVSAGRQIKDYNQHGINNLKFVFEMRDAILLIVIESTIFIMYDRRSKIQFSDNTLYII